MVQPPDARPAGRVHLARNARGRCGARLPDGRAHARRARRTERCGRPRRAASEKPPSSTPRPGSCAACSAQSRHRRRAAPAAATASGTEFKGTADSVAFVGDLPTGLGTTRRANITLELREARLVLRWTPRRHELSTAPPPEAVETELISPVSTGSTSPIGAGVSRPAGRMAGGMGWGGDPRAHPHCASSFAAGDRRRFPDLIAAPQP